jgi:predicted ribosome quality control (RQC) complex YloA/Tae2 family protein
MDITYLGNSARIVHYDRLSDMFDVYFAERDRLEKIHQRAKDLVTLLTNAIARTERKLAIQRQSLLDSERGEEYKRHADLITANLYQLKRGMTSFSAVDYYDENCPQVEINLDSRLSPTQNAQRLYKQYNKCKTAKVVLAEQIEKWEAELLYLDSVSTFLSKAESEQDLAEIREELYRSGYASKMRGYKSPKQIKSDFMKFVTSGGYPVLVGRNNMQNDKLTMKTADKHDIWFHTKDIPGSHVILVTGGEEPGEADYTEAAAIAAKFSKASGTNITVDYTEVKNIKKPGGSKPGFVTYKTNFSAVVDPMTDEELEARRVK